MRFGIQMCGLNQIFMKDKELFLERVVNANFQYMEPCLMLDEIPALKKYAWTQDEMEKFQPLFERYGIKINSAHVFTTDIVKDTQKIISIAENYQIRQIVFPCPHFQTIEQYAILAESLKQTADIMGKAGIELLIHNGKEDSIQKIDGISAYEWVLNKCDGKVFAQPDVGWLLYSGTDPEKFLWDNAKIIKSIHYKDIKKNNLSERMEEEIGLGDVDMVACFQFSRAHEIIQFIDQDYYGEKPLDAIDRIGNRFRKLYQNRDNTKSILCVMDSATGKVTELHTFDYIIEAPNWYQQNDDYLFYNANGSIRKYQISTGIEEKIESGICTNCNNDHVIKYDGREIAVSHSDVGWQSHIYILPIEGGMPRRITVNAPSFLHGWSPDGKELAYCAFRKDGEDVSADIYTIPVDGGQEHRLTERAGFNDGPEYSPDGKYILFISSRTGLMQNWRMKRDGSEVRQMTFSEKNNWFGHYSPDGKKIVYLSYSKEGLSPNEHLPNMHVELSVMNADGSDDHVILKFFGGQGSMNVNSWNPDSRYFAFVKYELMHK